MFNKISETFDWVVDHAVRGVVGGICSRVSVWLTYKVEDLTNLHIGGFFHAFSPNQITHLVQYCTQWTQTPLIFVSRALNARIQADTISERQYLGLEIFNRCLIAPIGEELIYRVILPSAGTFFLQQVGLDREIAKTISLSVSILLFGMAHTPDLNSRYFSATSLSGGILTYLNEEYGFATAVIAHAVHNGIDLAITQFKKRKRG